MKKIYQEWSGAVNTGTSAKVSYAFSFPTDGTTGLRRSASEVADLARSGDQAALQAFAVAVAGLAEALAAYTALLAPELVIIGGGLSGAADLIMDELVGALDDRLSFHRRPRLVIAALGSDAGVRGAGLLGWEHVIDEGTLR